MSKLDELIQELCPDGVEYKKLGDLIKIEKGKQLNKTHLFDKYEENLHPVINGGISPSGFWNEYNYSENLITISQGGASAGYVNYIKTKFSRAMLGLLKITQHNPPTVWAKVPLQDFTPNSDIDWTKSIPEIDQQLYTKYGLSQDEIDFIEEKVKVME